MQSNRFKADLSNMMAAKRARASGAAGGESPKSPILDFTDSPVADGTQVKKGSLGKPGKSKDKGRIGPMRAPNEIQTSIHGDRPAMYIAADPRLAPHSFHLTDQEKFGMKVKAVTEAAEAAGTDWKHTFLVGKFVFLPVNGKRLRFHKIFLRDACRSFRARPSHTLGSDWHML